MSPQTSKNSQILAYFVSFCGNRESLDRVETKLWLLTTPLLSLFYVNDLKNYFELKCWITFPSLCLVLVYFPSPLNISILNWSNCVLLLLNIVSFYLHSAMHSTKLKLVNKVYIVSIFCWQSWMRMVWLLKVCGCSLKVSPIRQTVNIPFLVTNGSRM